MRSPVVPYLLFFSVISRVYSALGFSREDSQIDDSHAKDSQTQGSLALQTPCTGDSLYLGFPQRVEPRMRQDQADSLYRGFPVLRIPRHKIPALWIPCTWDFATTAILLCSTALLCFTAPQCFIVLFVFCAAACVLATACVLCHSVSAPRMTPSRSLHPSFISSPHHALGEFIEHRLGWRHEHYPTYSFFCGFLSFSQRDAAGVRPADVRTADVRTVSICSVNVRHDVRH